MPITAICPQCQTRFEIPADLADQPVRCHRCMHTFAISAKPSPAIQPGPAPARSREHDAPDEFSPPHRPQPRSPFPTVSLLVLALGLVSLLLVISLGFNAWLLLSHERRGFMDDMAQRAELEARRAEQEAMAARAMAEQNAALARQQEVQAKLQQQERLRQNEDLKRQLEIMREQLEDAKRPQPKELEEKDPPAKEKSKEPAPPAKIKEEANSQQAWGTLQGRVVFKGELPKIKSLEGTLRIHADAGHILKAPKTLFLDPTWRIDPKTKGVANVAIYLKRPTNGILPIHPEDKVRKDRIVMDAPFCIFEPHMVAVYPEWFNGAERGKTGQKFVLKNSSPVIQSRRLTGHPSKNYSHTTIEAMTEREDTLQPQQLPISIQNDIHGWMPAYAWVFDHPYYAISKEDGSFTIPRVPAGMDVQVMAWHESQGWLFTKEGKTMTLTAGKNTLDFEMAEK